MPRPGRWLRVFVGLLLAIVPPIVLVLAGLLVAEPILRSVDQTMVALLIVLGALAWAAVLAAVYDRDIGDDVRQLVALAERGRSPENSVGGSAFDALATALEERNRQIAMLAREVGTLAIFQRPLAIVATLLTAVRGVTGDATWRLAVLDSADPALLPPAVYDGEAAAALATSGVGDLEQWAAGVASEHPAVATGPWGAFNVVRVSTTDTLRAILLAPWEGRPPPSPSVVDLLTLVGQHTGTALEHALLYARVQSQADELHRLAEIQSDFLRGVTHDLQTPLTSIGAVSAELAATPGLPSRAKADLQTIEHQADRLRRMVGQLLVASRLEAGAVVPRHDVFAVMPLVERTWSALRADRPLEVAVDGVPHLAVGDPDRFEQVLWAVLDNAVKYSPSGSPIEVRVSAHAGWLAVTIRDHGSGMDEETRARAFDQFYRAEYARKLVPDGSGVGLYAARGLMVAMGGSIEATSTLGSGTEISLRLPAEVADRPD